MTRLGIVAALPDEARCLGVTRPRAGRHYQLHRNTRVYVAGMGRHNATRAAQALIHDGVCALASWGFCGALDAALLPGMLVLPETVLDADSGERFDADSGWRTGLHDKLAAAGGLRTSADMLLTCTAIVPHAGRKQALRQTTRAVAVDMESAAIAAVARQAGLPFVAIRSISDAAHASIPSTALAMMGTSGQVHPLRGCKHWLRHPQQTAALLQLARGTRRARRSLCTAARLAGPQLLYTAHK